MGWVFNFTDNLNLDVYGKYFWSRVEGGSEKLKSEERLHLDAVTSSRSRLGGRLTFAGLGGVADIYLDAAWEHEFDAKAEGTVNGFTLPSVDLEGDTGIGELGVTLTPWQSVPLVIDVAGQGYTGKREGFTGSVFVKFSF